MATQKNKLKICFVALNCYNLLSDRKDITHNGGAEVQQWLIAQWLQKNGYDVSFVTMDHGQAAVEEHQGIRVFKAYKENAGLPVVRFFHPRWSGIWAAMKHADADIYYQRGGGVETGQVAAWCQLHGKKFVYGLANDADCTRELALLYQRREKLMYRMGLSLVDGVITQTKNQQSLIKKNYSITSTVVRNCGGPLSRDEEKIRDELTLNKNVLWVGRISPEKRFEWIVDVAERCSDYNFTVVGASNHGSAYETKLLQRATALPNVKHLGHIHHEKMIDIYRQSSFLCSTSIIEGFPNVYLEAWRLGIPVLGSFDPDGVIASSGAGWVTESVDDYVRRLEEISQNPTIWHQASSAAKNYYLNNHTLEINMPIFESVVQAVVS